MRLSPRNQLLLVSVGVLLVIIVLVVVLVIPQFRRIGEMEAQIDEADARADQAQALLARRQEAKAGAAGTDAALLELTSAVPENPDLPALLIELQDLAYESNVELTVVTPDELIGSVGYMALPISITIRGGWIDTVDFVQRLQAISRQARIVSTKTVLLNESDLDAGVMELDIYAVESDIEIETYVVPASSGSTSTVPAAPAAPAAP